MSEGKLIHLVNKEQLPSGPVLLHCKVNGGNAGERRRTQIPEGTAPQMEGVAGMRQGAFRNFMQTSDVTRFVL